MRPATSAALATVSALVLAVSLTGCASRGKSAASPEKAATSEAPAAEAYYAEEYSDGRFYVFGTKEVHEQWKGPKTLNFARTFIGSGPHGATVVYEAHNEWPELTDWLQQKFEYAHWTDKPAYYGTIEHDGRTYVFGKPETEAEFRSSHSLTYARSKIGGRVGGGTVMFEIDPKDPALTDWLERQYYARTSSTSAAAPMPAPAAGGYYGEVERDGRFYVAGSQKSHDTLRSGGEIPLRRTFIGGGPGGKTVVIEADSKTDDLANRLQAEFERRHGPIRR